MAGGCRLSGLSRRDALRLGLAAGSALVLPGLQAHPGREALLRRPVPSSGELLPVIGLGSSATFRAVAQSDDAEALGAVLQAMVGGGASVFDTAPSYGDSEEVAGRLAAELGLTKDIFWATKVNVAPRGGGPADPAAARTQIEQSFARIGVKKMDLIQVHNLGDVPVQLGTLRKLKEAGRVRYTGVTSTSKSQYPELVRVMREELDFIGVDYAIDNRDVEETILPLAAERGIAVMVYLPFGRTSLFRRVGDRALPDWAADIDAASWAQVFLKFLLGHPAVTVVTPATSKVKHLLDNLAGGRGRLPDAALRSEMAAFIDALPAPAR